MDTWVQITVTPGYVLYVLAHTPPNLNFLAPPQVMHSHLELSKLTKQITTNGWFFLFLIMYEKYEMNYNLTIFYMDALILR